MAWSTVQCFAESSRHHGLRCTMIRLGGLHASLCLVKRIQLVYNCEVSVVEGVCRVQGALRLRV